MLKIQCTHHVIRYTMCPCYVLTSLWSFYYFLLFQYEYCYTKKCCLWYSPARALVSSSHSLSVTRLLFLSSVYSVQRAQISFEYFIKYTWFISAGFWFLLISSGQNISGIYDLNWPLYSMLWRPHPIFKASLCSAQCNGHCITVAFGVISSKLNCWTNASVIVIIFLCLTYLVYSFVLLVELKYENKNWNTKTTIRIWNLWNWNIQIQNIWTEHSCSIGAQVIIRNWLVPRQNTQTDMCFVYSRRTLFNSIPMEFWHPANSQLMVWHLMIIIKYSKFYDGAAQ